jgi:hypothetical protein
MKTYLTHLSAALAIAAAAAACTGRNHSVGNDRRTQGGGDRGVNERIALRGCVQPAPAGQGYALRHVVVVPSTEQPQGQETMEHPLIARGSWVRLAAGSGMTDDLKTYLNNEVAITGDIVDRGENTIGTAGRDGSAQEQTLPRASVANGNAPRVAVETVKKIAENCAGE